VRNEYRGARSRFVRAVIQGNSDRTFVNQDDFIFVQMLVGWNPVFRRHLLSANHERVRPGTHRVHLEDERLVAKQHPAISLFDLKYRGCGPFESGRFVKHKSLALRRQHE
jgi:hypothetical protein